MAKFVFKLAIFLHNVSGFLNHNFKNNRFSVSRVKMLLSFFLLVSSLFVIYIFSTNRRLNEKVFRSATSQFKELSTFFRLSTVITVFLLHLSGTFFSLSSRLIAQKVEIFLNHAISLRPNKKCYKKFRKSCLQQTAVVCVLHCAVTFLKFLAITKLRFVYFLVFLIFLYPTCVALSFVTFVKGFEIFVCELLKDFEKAIVINNKSDKKDFELEILA